MNEIEKDNFTSELIEQTPAGALMREANQITKDIVAEKDPDKVKDLTALFELNQKKKNIARVNKLSNLLELVDDEVINRFTDTPEDFDNALLLKYMESTQRTINEMDAAIDQQPLIQIQKNEINITNDNSGLNRESRKKVLDAVMSILESSKSDVVLDEEDIEVK